MAEQPCKKATILLTQSYYKLRYALLRQESSDVPTTKQMGYKMFELKLWAGTAVYWYHDMMLTPSRSVTVEKLIMHEYNNLEGILGTVEGLSEKIPQIS